MFFFFSSRRRHTRCREVSWARRCVQETGEYIDSVDPEYSDFIATSIENMPKDLQLNSIQRRDYTILLSLDPEDLINEIASKESQCIDEIKMVEFLVEKNRTIQENKEN
eukprot:TRINITY_DN52743_c0_g1_i1.p2 TRINITY_DN52743_c0_g1~~TRINITY_DN52743_c0_g1_i1.p2  ORF type:complete len:109 (-),score=50.02 TRINITY_DN52743_c0_g1_i1:14-340(-)